MKMKKKKFDGKSSATILLGVMLCLFMSVIYMASTSTLKTSYALPDEIDAKDVSQIKTKIVNISDYNSGITNGVTLGGKWQGIFSVNNVQYVVDMFCLEFEKGMPGDATYNKLSDSSSYIDDGISYIINTAYKDSTLQSNTVTLSNEDYYAAQTAIWIYQLKVLGYKANTTIEAEGLGDTTDNINKMWESVNQNHSSGVAKKIYDYVMNAKAAKESTSQNKIELSNGNLQFNLSSDKSYYETEPISVNVTTKNANTTFDGFRFTLNSNNYNTKVVDNDGNEITDLNSINGKTFRIRVDATNLNVGSEANITGTISGVFKTNSFLAFKNSTNTEKSQVALLVTNNKSEDMVELKGKISVPDTGRNLTSYIYIIGAMILVLGTSVIYVNAKAKK